MRRAFSLIEVLICIFILAIGMIMVLAVFPVGGKWSKDAVEQSNAQLVAQNALTIIKSHYLPGSKVDLSPLLASLPNGNTTDLQALPGLVSIPLAERAYQFGSSTPYPAPNPQACTWFWTALARATPGQQRGATRSYEVYVVVFNKGNASDAFNTVPANSTLIGNTRGPGETFVPTLASGPYNAGTYNANRTPAITGAVPAIGGIGLGRTSGTVFHQNVSAIGGGAIASPVIGPADSEIIFSPPADGATASPLVYVYQVTLTL